jgi:ATP/maltotriose-dependent transcriptional regulator MalT
VSAAPDRLDDRVLPALGVDLPTLRRLDASGLLGRARGGLVFHHELARQAIETTIPPGGGPRLHARLLGALERVGLRDPAVLTHHAVAARDTARAAGYARAAAQEAIEAGSHTEAAAFFETALENLADAPAAERAELLLELAFEQYMTSRLGDAIANVRATFPLWQRSGDPAGLSAAYVSCALFEYYNARRHHAEAHAERAASIAADSGDQLHYGMARSTRALLAYLRSDLDLARACYTDASRIAREVSDDELALRSRLIQDAMALAEGDVDARRRLAQHIEEARAHGWDELASTGYSNLASIDVEQRRYREAGHVLEESLPFTVERDITICRHWQTSVRSRLHFAEGHWSAALEDAEQVLDNQGMPIATLWPYLITCLIPLRRGDEIPAANLDAAWELAEQLDEPVRRLAVMSARAERMWMTEVADPLVTQGAVHALATLGAAPATAWAAGELAVWLNRLGLAEKPPPSAAEPFRLTLEGHFDEAAAWWRRAGEPFAEAVTMGDSSDPRARARGVELLDRLGAIGTADRLRIGLRRDGLTQIPARPRNSTRANPAGLTNRQLDVAKLLARGLTNAEIASRLYISAKTADHHVSAVLTKMGLPNRRSVALHAEELGLI